MDIFIQARMGSTRLPNKVMRPIMDQPMLHYLLERVKRVKNAKSITVLTTQLPADDLIAECAHHEKVGCFRGSSENVLERFHQAAQQSKAIIRLTADCPLIDPELIDEMITYYLEERVDYLSNTMMRTYPRGMDIEIFSYQALDKAYKCVSSPEEKEHVTLYMYRHPEQFVLKNIASKVDLSSYRLTVDTLEDFKLIEHIFNALYPENPHFSLKEIIRFLEEHPKLLKINAHIQQKHV